MEDDAFLFGENEKVGFQFIEWSGEFNPAFPNLK